MYITNKDANVIGTELETEMNHVMLIELLFKFKSEKRIKTYFISFWLERFSADEFGPWQEWLQKAVGVER